MGHQTIRHPGKRNTRLGFTLLTLIGVLCTAGLRAADLRLSLKEAVDMALSEEGNTAVQVAKEMIQEFQARSRQSRAPLLPNLEGSVSEQSQVRNLEAFGLQPSGLFRPPDKVGPFAIFDARATLTQTIINLGAWRRYQASKVAVTAAQTEKTSTEDRTAAQVARTYLTALRNQARLDTAAANVELAEALLELAQNQKDAGTGTGIEITRAQVQLSNQRHLQLAARQQYSQAVLTLLQQIGANLNDNLLLTESLEYQPVEVTSVSQALALALQSRSDLQVQRHKEEEADLGYRATRMDRMPSLAGIADYGAIGNRANDSFSTWSVAVSLRLPLFDGGRQRAHQAETQSRLHQQQIHTQDLQQQIELEIRLSLDGLQVAEQQIQSSQEGLGLAEQELAQAERRYRAGITNSVEVTDAQTRLERARENHIEALFNHSFQRINLGEAMGTIRSML
jgi:outer membrane protein TolC